MALLLETTLGDLVIDLDVEGSPALCQNMLQLAEARYYTQTLLYNIQANRFCQLGDPHGDGTGGACYQGVLSSSSDGGSRDVTQSTKRFLKSQGRRLTAMECMEKGRVVATEMKGIPDTIGSQFLITLAEGPGMALDGYTVDDGDGNKNNGDSGTSTFLSLGRVIEDDDNVLQQLASLYCDSEGRPFVDVRIKRALVIHNPFLEDNNSQQQLPPELKNLMAQRGVKWEEDEEDRICKSPDYERPPEERVKPRITADQVELVDDEDEEALQKLQQLQDEEAKKHDAKSRAVVLEMLGDLPDADIKAPENVLFVCKLNPVTEDEDLELIFSRFDNNVKAEIIRDQDTGASLQYAFVEFTHNKQAEEAYFKMNNALVDDRRIKVDFSQSVAKMWDRFNQKLRPTALKPEDIGGGRGGGGRGGRDGRGARGRGGWGGRGRGGRDFPQGGRGRSFQDDNRRQRDHPGGHSNNPRHDHRHSSGRHPSEHRNGNDSSRGGHGRSFDDNRGRGPSDRERSFHRPNVDEFGRAVAPHQPSHGDNNGRGRSASPPDDRRRSHSHRRRSSSRSDSRSPSPDHRRRRSSSRDRDRKSRKHHKSSHKHKKKDRKHDRDDRHHRRRDDSDDDSRANDSKRRSHRRYDSDDEPGNSSRKRRYESDASDDHHKSKRKHSKHHKKHHSRKRSRSR